MPSVESGVIALAEIIKEWGVKGEVKALPLSQRFLTLSPGRKVCILRPDGARQYTAIRSIKKLGRHYALSFSGVPDTESASALRGSSICIGREEVFLEENEFFYDEIIGIPVFTTDGEMIGRVEEIIETRGNDVYVVKMHAKEYLLPAIRDVVREIDLGEGRMIIKPMPGLLD